MADCSNIFTFMKEWERRSKTEICMTFVETLETIDNGTNGKRNYSVKDMVEELQKWSDEHPFQTRKEKFIQMCKENGFEDLAELQCKGGMPECKCNTTNCIQCKDYWNSPAE